MKIILLPGLDGTGTLLAEIEALLSVGHSVARLQFPPDLFRYDALTAWVERRLPNDDFLLVAESFSGPLAVMIASGKPAGLKGVVFAATFAQSPRKAPVVLAHVLQGLPIKSRLFAWLAQPFLMGRWANKEFTTAFRQAIRLVPAVTLAGRLKEVRNVDVVPQLKCLTVPSLYLMAAQDRLVPKAISLEFEQTTETVIQIDGPHCLLQAKPNGTATHILNFAARLA